MRVPFDSAEKKLIRETIEEWYCYSFDLSEKELEQKKANGFKIPYETIFTLRRTQGPFGAINYFSFRNSNVNAFTVYADEGDCYVLEAYKNNWG